MTAKTAADYNETLVFGTGSEVAATAVIHESDRGRKTIKRPRRCGRCGGQGGAEAWKYTGWTCYQCGGKGIDGIECLPVYTAAEFAKLEQARAKRRATALAKHEAREAAVKAEADAKRAAFEAQHADVLPWLREECARLAETEQHNEFLSSLLAKADRWAEWSEAQAKAVRSARDKIIEARRVRAASGWIGKVGERLLLTAKVERVRSIEVRDPVAYWKMQTLYITSLRDDEGNAIVVKSNAFRVAEGDEVRIRGTVKEHGEYKGQKQTVLNRVKIVEE